MKISRHINRAVGKSDWLLNREHGGLWQDPRLQAMPFWMHFARISNYFEDMDVRHSIYPHHAFEIVQEGELNVLSGGRKILLRAGDAIFLSPGGDYRLLLYPGQQCVKAACSFSGSQIHTIFTAAGFVKLSQFHVGAFEPGIALIRKLHAMLDAKTPGSEPAICGNAYELFMLLREAFLGNRQYPPLLEDALHMLALHIPVRITVREICGKLHCSIRNLELLFSQHLHTSPAAYLRCLKMNTAAEILRNSSIPIQEVAEKVGYAAPLEFSREFKKFHGVSPRSFRKDDVSKDRSAKVAEKQPAVTELFNGYVPRNGGDFLHELK